MKTHDLGGGFIAEEYPAGFFMVWWLDLFGDGADFMGTARSLAQCYEIKGV